MYAGRYEKIGLVTFTFSTLFIFFAISYIRERIELLNFIRLWKELYRFEDCMLAFGFRPIWILQWVVARMHCTKKKGVNISFSMRHTPQYPIRTATLLIIFLSIQSGVKCGFSDSIEPHNMDHVLTGLRTPRVSDNSSISLPGATTKNDKRQAFVPTTYANHLSALANMANFGGFGPMGSMGSLRTVMMGGMLYGLSLIPAVVLALGGNGLPMGGILSSLGLSKRALPETSSAKMPLLSESQTRRLLQMLQSAFKQWNIADEDCKQLFVCQMYRQVSSNGVSPDLDLFKEALLHILERGGQRRAGRAAEHLLAEYDHYFQAARLGMKLQECETHYPRCDLSLYPLNDGFKKGKKSKPVEDKVNKKKDKQGQGE